MIDEPPPPFAQPFVIQRVGTDLPLKWAVYRRIGDGRGAKTFGEFDSFTAATKRAAELTREYRRQHR